MGSDLQVTKQDKLQHLKPQCHKGPLTSVFSNNIKHTRCIQGFFFLSDLIFLAAQHTQCCLHISTCLQSMMWILSLMRSVVASLHHPKLHTCQQEATGAKKKETFFFSLIPRMVVHPTTIMIHVWEDCIMTRLLSLWSHTHADWMSPWGSWVWWTSQGGWPL